MKKTDCQKSNNIIYNMILSYKKLSKQYVVDPPEGDFIENFFHC